MRSEQFACGVLLGLSAVIGYIFADVAGAALGVLTFFYFKLMCGLIGGALWPKYYVRQSDLGGFIIPDRRTITVRKSEFQIEIEKIEAEVRKVREQIRLRRKNLMERSWE